MTVDAHRNRQRAEGFGEDAPRYDRSRPRYPVALIEDVLDGCDMPARVLDVGCGTGRAAFLFMERDCIVVGVEPDARMAALARSHGVTVDVCTFEAWEPADRHFDVVISAQAWHWIDPAVGASKAAAALGPGGRLALFWNAVRHERRRRPPCRPCTRSSHRNWPTPWSSPPPPGRTPTSSRSPPPASSAPPW